MRSIFLVFSFVLLTACSENSTNNPNCQFLLDVGVNVTINLSLPEYSQLQFVSNSVYIANAGNKGIIVTNAGSGFFAWDAGDPNHAQSNCSVLQISGLEAICGCDDKNTYSLVTGQPLDNSSLQCGLKNYRIEQSGSNLFVSN